jgi:hypothetical protein
MDGQLRSDYFGLYTSVFDTFKSKTDFEADLLEEFLRFSALNHTKSMGYEKSINLTQLIEVKMKEVLEEMESRSGMFAFRRFRSPKGSLSHSPQAPRCR